MLNLRETLWDLLTSWNMDHPEEEISEEFAHYAAAALRDRIQNQFSSEE